MSVRDIVAEAAVFPAFEVGLSADNCLKCNVCNTVCPVARVTDLFPGPKYVGPQAQRFRVGTLLSPSTPGSHVVSPDRTVDWCSGCGMCTNACPADVKIAEMNNRARAQMKSGHRPRLRDWLLGQTDFVGRMGVLTAPIANWSLRLRPFRVLIDWFIGIHRRAPLPAFATRTLRSRLAAERRRSGATLALPSSPEPPPERAVVLFHGCAANYYEPEVALAAIEVLERNGLATIVPEQVCCGLPMISNGLYAGARGRARTNLGVLAEYARRGYRIVGTSTSCTHTLKSEYREMLDLDDADARAVSDATWDICELLVELNDEGRLDTRFGSIEETLPYHAPCQLRSHGIGLPAMELFALVPGLSAVDLDHDCCGVAGTYGLKKEKYDIAMAVGAPLFARVQAAAEAGATRAVCDSETCRWQIAAATSTPVVHPVQVLAAAYAAADAADAASNSGLA
ncbi:MAG TPA: anaerobic glycerol-3-phosphate dehydrogenase subunit C [Candidatus Limnocylindrales bacterium]|nr:anaerobic glycerol-3-phosphate dehydrogenase subunit C [Candidatus Limnocylindrales bacterium]